MINSSTVNVQNLIEHSLHHGATFFIGWCVEENLVDFFQFLLESWEKSTVRIIQFSRPAHQSSGNAHLEANCTNTADAAF